MCMNEKVEKILLGRYTAFMHSYTRESAVPERMLRCAYISCPQQAAVSVSA